MGNFGEFTKEKQISSSFSRKYLKLESLTSANPPWLNPGQIPKSTEVVVVVNTEWSRENSTVFTGDLNHGMAWAYEDRR